ncbi:type II toxin-antitoxin system RelE/ParE family toxin [Methylopila musalis]|uniref:Type II toxin-antitoxin system RelE/ParE family toxin n=1 Tax=Methylopila musalis TaxID=1134781 RepID=A0ABW3ZCE8_9HYPH
MKVVFSAQARAEILGIGRHVAQDDPDAAERLVRRLIERCLSLDAAPRQGPVVARLRGHEIHRLVHGSHLIFYTVADAVRILRVVHGARSPRLLLKDLDPTA